ncbi:hypothetical protein IFR05_013607 [Cadophora sp. M221]|nr:hypothetical protein IFR05_013607 [Cadophora sp. M221]
MPIWNPRAILDVYPEAPGFTCVGTTKKGLRCRNSFIRHQYLVQASEILDSLSRVSIGRADVLYINFLLPTITHAYFVDSFLSKLADRPLGGSLARIEPSYLISIIVYEFNNILS